MGTIRCVTILLLSLLANAQEIPAPQTGHSGTPIPKLPFIDDAACPGKGQAVPNVKITQAYQVYSSWHENRKQIGRLKAGQSVTIVEGVNVVRKPDKAVVRYVGPTEESLSLKVGDAVLGYGIEYDGNDVFWAKGTWFVEYQEGVAVKGHCGFTDPTGCTINIVEHGNRDWWVRIRSRSGLRGWILADTLSGDKRWLANFYPLCHYGED